MSRLSGLASARGLAPADREVVADLVKVYDGVQARNQRLRDYYEGDIRVDDFGITIDPSKLQNDQVCDWPAQAVDALDQLISLDGFIDEDGERDEVLEAIAKECNLVGNYQKYKKTMMIDGCMAAVVNNADGGVEVRFHSAATFAAIPDGNHDSGKIAAGFVIASTKKVDWSAHPVPTAVNVYMPGRVIILTRYESAMWTAESYDTPERDPLMFVFSHNADGMKPFGRSRITKSVMSLTRDAVRTMWRMEVAAAYYSIPKLAVLGLSDEQFDDMCGNKWKIQADGVNLFTRDENGNVPTLQQIASNSPQPFIDELDKLAGMLSGSTGVPLTDLGVASSTYTSSASSSAAREKLQKAAQDQIDSDTRVLERVAAAAMAVADGVAVDELDPKRRTVTADFADTNATSRAAMADAGVKLCSVAPWFANTDLFLKWQGFKAADIMQVRRARDSYETSAALDALVQSSLDQSAAETAEAT